MKVNKRSLLIVQASGIAIVVVASMIVGAGQTVEQNQGANIPQFELVDQTLLDGLEKLTQLDLPLNIGIEAILREHHSDQPAGDVRFSMHLSNTTLTDIIDALCKFDSRYSWSKNGNTINIYPRSTIGDESYLLNLHIESIALNDIHNPDEVLTSIARQLPTPKQQIGYAQLGGDITYAKPWTARFDNLTVRQLINRVAEHLGPKTVWMFQGSKDERLFTFQRGALQSNSNQ